MVCAVTYVHINRFHSVMCWSSSSLCLMCCTCTEGSPTFKCVRAVVVVLWWRLQHRPHRSEVWQSLCRCSCTHLTLSSSGWEFKRAPHQGSNRILSESNEDADGDEGDATLFKNTVWSVWSVAMHAESRINVEFYLCLSINCITNGRTRMNGASKGQPTFFESGLFPNRAAMPLV